MTGSGNNCTHTVDNTGGRGNYVLFEFNSITLTTTRLADLNAGNVLVIAADSTGTSPENMFKIQQLTVQQSQPGVYENKAAVSAQGITDSDLSHCRNPAAPTLTNIGDRIWSKAVRPLRAEVQLT